MRRLFAAAALTLVVLTGAACSKSNNNNNQNNGKSDTATVCAAIQRVTVEAEGKLQSQMLQLAQDLQSGDTSKQAAAVQAFKDFMTGWAASIRQEGAKASDPQLTQSLNDLSTQIETAAGSVTDFNSLANIETVMNSAALQQAGNKVETYCPNINVTPSST
jgi:hypothetical protein